MHGVWPYARALPCPVDLPWDAQTFPAMPAGWEGREQQQEAAPTRAAETLPGQRRNKKIKMKQQIGFSFRIQNPNASTQQQKGFRRETLLPGEKPQRAGNAPRPSWPRHVHQPGAHRCWQHPNTARGISGLTSRIRAAALTTCPPPNASSWQDQGVTSQPSFASLPPLPPLVLSLGATWSLLAR